MKFLGRALVVPSIALLLAAPAFSQSDQQFMSEAAQDGMAKIQWAYLALQNAQNEQVRMFAQQILSDYGNAQNGLIYIANQEGVVLPRDLSQKDQGTYVALSQLHGADFDKAYMKAMSNERQTDLSRLKDAKVGSAAIAEWASKTLPVLQSDLKTAQKVAPVVGVHPTPKSEERPDRSAGGSGGSAEPQNPH